MCSSELHFDAGERYLSFCCSWSEIDVSPSDSLIVSSARKAEWEQEKNKGHHTTVKGSLFGGEEDDEKHHQSGFSSQLIWIVHNNNPLINICLFGINSLLQISSATLPNML